MASATRALLEAQRRSEAAALPARYISVASYNLHSCVGLDRRCAPSRIAAVLRELNCDIFALQEVDNRPGEIEESMQLQYLSKALDMAAVPGLRIVRHTGEYGNAILTRLPILKIERHDLSYSWYEPRGALDVDIDVEGRPLKVIAAHLGLRRAERRFQWRRLMAAVAQVPAETPIVMLGDMNEWYRGSKTLKEAHQILGEPPAPVAFPSFAPLLALTRIWVRPRAALQSIDVHRTELSRKASDHLPLKATIDVGRLVGAGQ